ncbi:hypothetical protein T09_561 [Trichinella sp. T9]|nr:hypothetical protein T09_561 [Trichinella sp. T9]KRZ91139.1 hypothetical protein T08_5779 [Trichinella sp. T8]
MKFNTNIYNIKVVVQASQKPSFSLMPADLRIHFSSFQSG